MESWDVNLFDRFFPLNKVNEQNQLHVFENNFLYFKTLTYLIAEWL